MLFFESNNLVNWTNIQNNFVSLQQIMSKIA